MYEVKNTGIHKRKEEIFKNKKSVSSKTEERDYKSKVSEETRKNPENITILEKMKIGIELFLFFFKIGCFTFGGGWSILAQMEQEFVDKRKWLTQSELLDMVAVGRSVPGIMITNISMIFGYSMGGVFGGFCAVLGMTAPAILILSVATLFYSKLKDNIWCAGALRGIRCAVVPIIASAALSLGKAAFKTKVSIAAGMIALLLCIFTDIGNIELVCLGVAAVLIWQGYIKLTSKKRSRKASIMDKEI